jgi:hypothetical protein
MVSKKFIVIQLFLSVILGFIWLITFDNDSYHALFIISFFSVGVSSQLYASYINRNTLKNLNKHEIFIYRLFRQIISVALLIFVFLIFSVLQYFLRRGS